MSDEFKKTLKQVEATKIMASYKHSMLYGGSRSGKTFNIVRGIIIRACKLQSRHISLRSTFSSARTSLWMDTIPKVLKLCFPHLVVKPNNSNYYLEFPNGSEYWIGGLKDNKEVEKILGNEYSTIHFNECSQLNYHSVQVALTRLAQKNHLKKRAFYDQNPPRKSHWSYSLFEKLINPIDNEPLDCKANKKYGKILMNPIDNLDNIDSDYLDMLNSLSEKEKARFLRGEYTDIDDGLAYYSFDRFTHCHEFKKQPGTVMIGMDFNVDPMTAIIGQYIDDKFYVYDELFLRNSDTFKMTHELMSKNYIGTIFPDSTARNRKTSGLSDHLILEKQGFTVAKTRNPFVNDRVNNLNRLLQEGRIIIHPRCKNLINDLEKVAWNGSQLDQKSDHLLTHISDALGYWCWAIEPMKKQIEDRFNITRI